jgi:hypothetical protein
MNDLVWFRPFRDELSRVELWRTEPASESIRRFAGNEANRVTPGICTVLARRDARGMTYPPRFEVARDKLWSFPIGDGELRGHASEEYP